ncbi:hypothetical protein KIN20_006971 [Parelaphostrongylus tenuis]|uniref:Uncharacterized protein n=1 Tax=Parelaphostrongylus tenuis TaxID=148309 RepID=A0AAD5MNX4_PARTN|nr:hypothetical protein KIN20_006971 [Parelaphostrongylus tenuis]
MADNIVRQLCVEFRKKRVLAANEVFFLLLLTSGCYLAAETVVENADIHKKL